MSDCTGITVILKIYNNTRVYIAMLRVDLTSKVFGRLTVLEPLLKSKWLCSCQCGNTKVVSYRGLKSGKTKSCGCLKKELTIQHNKETKLKNIVGQRFSRLLVLEDSGERNNGVIWSCLCDCGNIKNVSYKHLVAKQYPTKSCGCLKEEIKEKGLKHGQSKSKEYKIWMSMCQRCTNPKNRNYKNYGGRGITVSEDWLHSFENFYRDMGSKPFPKASIERVDNDKGYNSNNCKWASRDEQCLNKRTNIYIKYKNSVKTLGEWSEELNKGREVLKNRLVGGLGSGTKKDPYIAARCFVVKRVAKQIFYKGEYYTVTELAKLCGVTRSKIEYALKKNRDLELILE